MDSKGQHAVTRNACKTANNRQQDRTDRLEDSEAPRGPRPSLLRTGQARSPQVSHRPEAPWATGVPGPEALLSRLLRTLTDVISSCVPHCPTPQCVCAHRERCSQVRAPTGREPAEHTATVRNQGTEGTGTRQIHGKETGRTSPPRHRTTRVSSPSTLLQDKGQGSVTLGLGLILALPLKTHTASDGSSRVCRPHSPLPVGPAPVSS